MGIFGDVKNWIVLRKVDGKSRPRWEQREGTRMVRVVDVYDGDTFTVLMVHGWRGTYRRRCRCIGYDSPEMKGDNKDAAQRAKKHLESVIPKTPFRLTFKGTDKYGRLLVTFPVAGEPLDVHMIRMGHGYAYDGGKKRS